MNNHDYFKNTFDEVHLPKEAFDRVRVMNEQTSAHEYAQSLKKKKRKTIKYVSCLAAVIMICLIAVNFVKYVSGSRMINDMSYGSEDVQDDGMVTKSVILTEDEDLFRDFLSDESDSDDELTGRVVSEDESLYFVIDDCDVRIDITEDMSEGYCRGEFHLGNILYAYEVVDIDGDYDVHVYKK